MTVYPRGNVFYFETTLRGGKRIKRSTGVTLEEGERKAREVALALLKKMSDEQPCVMTLSIAIKETYDTVWAHKKDSETPLQRALSILEILGDVPLESIDDSTVLHLRNILMRDRGLSRATINRYLASLSTIFTACKTPNKPRFPRFKEPQGRIRYLTIEEEQELLEYLYSTDLDIYAGMFEVLLDTGMRFGELNTLLFRDINYSKKQIHVWNNKGDLPRTVPMTTRVHQKLLERRSETSHSQPYGLDYWSCYRAFTRAKEAIGLANDTEFCIHALRHTCASRLVQRGVSLYVVQKILGHSSIQVTEKYAHLNTDTLREAVGVLEPPIPPPDEA